MSNKLLTRMTAIPTKRFRRNIIILMAVLSIAMCVGIVTIAKTLEKEPDVVPVASQVIQQVAPVDEKPVVTNIQDSSENYNTPQAAIELIQGYYSALASKDSTALRKLGCDDTATALEQGWLDSIGWALDTSKVANLSAQTFPTSQGLYAGCTLYKISDFIVGDKPTDAIKSNVYGNCGLEGWVYYDALTSKWHLIDPTIPTSISAAQSKNVQRQSSDKSVTVKMSSPGAYANAWWSYTQVSVDITNSSSSTLALSKSTFDKGVTVSIAKFPNTVSPNGHVSGVAVVYRGILKDFGTEKIGASPLAIDGDVSPIRVAYGNEDVSPVFAIGNSDSKELQDLLASEQISKYGATSETVEEPSVLNNKKEN